jgi:hypothetical protein
MQCQCRMGSPVAHTSCAQLAYTSLAGVSATRLVSWSNRSMPSACDPGHETADKECTHFKGQHLTLAVLCADTSQCSQCHQVEKLHADRSVTHCQRCCAIPLCQHDKVVLVICSTHVCQQHCCCTVLISTAGSVLVCNHGGQHRLKARKAAQQNVSLKPANADRSLHESRDSICPCTQGLSDRTFRCHHSHEVNGLKHAQELMVVTA